MTVQVVLLDENAERAALMRGALRNAGHEVLEPVAAPGDLLARAAVAPQDAIIIIGIDRPTATLLDALRAAGRHAPRPTIVFAEEGSGETMEAVLQAGVSAYVIAGLRPERVQSIVELASARFRACRALHEELEATRAQLAERKIIERAKGILMQKRRLSEDEAYRVLRKLAMDRNKRLGEIAQSIVSAAELLG